MSNPLPILDSVKLTPQMEVLAFKIMVRNEKGAYRLKRQRADVFTNRQLHTLKTRKNLPNAEWWWCLLLIPVLGRKRQENL